MTGDLHRRLLTLDGHLDAPIHFTRKGWSFADRHEHATEIAQVDIPRMADGNLSGGFFVIYTAQGDLAPHAYADARTHALRRSDEIDAAVARYADAMAIARTADEAERIHASGKLVVFKSIENSYPVGDDLGVLADFARAGVRLAGPVHNFANQLGDSATDAPRWNGLSPLGRRWVGEMNRLGIVLDGSHAADTTFDQMLELSATPMILSHSGLRAIVDTPRNIDDGRIRALAQRGGVICLGAIFLSAFRAGPERLALFAKLGRIGGLLPEEQRQLTIDWRAMDVTAPIWDATIDDYLRALFYLIEVAGVDHVGFGADFDGGGGLPGLEDVTALPKITAALENAGFADCDIGKMWSGNLLRVLRSAEDAAA